MSSPAGSVGPDRAHTISRLISLPPQGKANPPAAPDAEAVKKFAAIGIAPGQKFSL